MFHTITFLFARLKPYEFLVLNFPPFLIVCLKNNLVKIDQKWLKVQKNVILHCKKAFKLTFVYYIYN